MLMINNHFPLFQLPGNLSKTKKMCSLFPWQHAISYLLIFFGVKSLFSIYSIYDESKKVDEPWIIDVGTKFTLFKQIFGKSKIYI
jgi:hypothetical protein